MRSRTIIFLVLALAGAGMIGVWHQRSANETGRPDGAETSRIRAWARSQGGAGPSVLPKRVPAADARELRRLEELPGFHAYAMRCSSCHVLPDPAAYTGDRWIGKVESMRQHTVRAGVLPPPESELDSVRLFLRGASEALHPK